jgi:hypothetical protein
MRELEECDGRGCESSSALALVRVAEWMRSSFSPFVFLLPAHRGGEGKKESSGWQATGSIIFKCGYSFVGSATSTLVYLADRGDEEVDESRSTAAASVLRLWETLEISLPMAFFK